MDYFRIMIVCPFICTVAFFIPGVYIIKNPSTHVKFDNYGWYNANIYDCSYSGLGPYYPKFYAYANETNLQTFVIDGSSKYKQLAEAIAKCRLAYPYGSTRLIYMSSILNNHEGYDSVILQSQNEKIGIALLVIGCVFFILFFACIITIFTTKEDTAQINSTVQQEHINNIAKKYTDIRIV